VPPLDSLPSSADVYLQRANMIRELLAAGIEDADESTDLLHEHAAAMEQHWRAKRGEIEQAAGMTARELGGRRRGRVERRRLQEKHGKNWFLVSAQSEAAIRAGDPTAHTVKQAAA
jgi:hypothetical protein